MKPKDKITISFTCELPEGIVYECYNEYFCEAIAQLNKIFITENNNYNQIKFFDGMLLRLYDDLGEHNDYITSNQMIRNSNSTC
jgi:hypothetical protein